MTTTRARVFGTHRRIAIASFVLLEIRNRPDDDDRRRTRANRRTDGCLTQQTDDDHGFCFPFTQRHPARLVLARGSPRFVSPRSRPRFDRSSLRYVCLRAKDETTLIPKSNQPTTTTTRLETSPNSSTNHASHPSTAPSHCPRGFHHLFHRHRRPLRRLLPFSSLGGARARSGRLSRPAPARRSRRRPLVIHPSPRLPTPPKAMHHPSNNHDRSVDRSIEHAFISIR